MAVCCLLAVRRFFASTRKKNWTNILPEGPFMKKRAPRKDPDKNRFEEKKSTFFFLYQDTIAGMSRQLTPYNEKEERTKLGTFLRYTKRQTDRQGRK